MVDKINPDSIVLDQLDGQWQKICTILVWKLARDGVKITCEDIDKLNAETDAGRAVMLSHGYGDTLELSIVTEERARVLAKWDAKQFGTA